jgi:hypothetical protein
MLQRSQPQPATASASASGFPGPLPQFRSKLQKTAYLLQPAAPEPGQLAEAITLPNISLAPAPLVNNVVTPGDTAALALFAKHRVPLRNSGRVALPTKWRSHPTLYHMHKSGVAPTSVEHNVATPEDAAALAPFAKYHVPLNHSGRVAAPTHT